MHPCKISVIVSTYNWPEALRAVLKGLNLQTCRDFEIIIADDGSNEKTSDLIKIMQKQMNLPIDHVHQADQGFRVSAIRNKAILQAKADYILFLDGDCIPPPRFIERHMALKERGFFVAGNRVLLSQDFTIRVLSEDLNIESWSFWRWCIARLSGQCNRILPFIRLPLGRLRTWSQNRWQGAMGCHLGVWREDLFKVNGWEEKYEGWGYEDSDLVIRLMQLGIKRKEARFSVPLIHLWHPIRSRAEAANNWAMLEMRQNTGALLAEQGLTQILHSSAQTGD